MYSQTISPTSPGCLIFLLDQSFSLAEPLPGSSLPAIEGLTAAVNRILNEVVSWGRTGESAAAPFDVAVLGYTTDRAGRPAITSLLQGVLAGRDLASTAELAAHPLVPRAGPPAWLRTPAPTTMLGTPTCAALRRCRQVAAAWADAHPSSFPPAVLHLTDGESTDGDPEVAARELQEVATRDGPLLLLSSRLRLPPAEVVLFPSAEGELPDEWTRRLFRASSLLPPPARQFFEGRGVAAPPGARCLAVNVDPARMLAFCNPDEVVLTLDLDEPGGQATEVGVTVLAPDAPEVPYRVPRCPGCDRKAPGQPGARYCMVCERTF